MGRVGAFTTILKIGSDRPIRPIQLGKPVPSSPVKSPKTSQTPKNLKKTVWYQVRFLKPWYLHKLVCLSSICRLVSTCAKPVRREWSLVVQKAFVPLHQSLSLVTLTSASRPMVQATGWQLKEGEWSLVRFGSLGSTAKERTCGLYSLKPWELG